MAHKKRHIGRTRRPNRQNVPHILDQFSHADLRTWRLKADSLNEYHVRLFYHLEGLRKLHHDALCDALRATSAISLPLQGWTRIVDYQYSLVPLSAKGSLIKGGRFNIGTDLDPGKHPPFPALYIAEDYETAYVEKFGAPSEPVFSDYAGHEFALRDPASFSSVRISGSVQNLFDLRRESNLKPFIKIINSFEVPADLRALAKLLGMPVPLLISTTVELKKILLDINWRHQPTLYDLPANSQIFGRMLVDAGFEGIVYQSTKGAKHCIAVFLKNLAGADSYIELIDEPPKGVKNVRLDKDTWSTLY